MQRQNPKNPSGYRFLLFLYWLISGYGEKCMRPLLWMGGLLVASTFGYLQLDLLPEGEEHPLSWVNALDWLTALLYSTRVIFLLKPEDFILSGLAAKALHTIQSLLGPTFITLFVLAVRQKMKR